MLESLDEAHLPAKINPNDTGGIVAATVIEVPRFRSVAQNKCKFVYVIQCQTTGRIKIGITDDIRSRLREIRAMSPTELALVNWFYSSGYDLEAHLHRMLCDIRLHGEWFEDDGRIGATIKMLDAFHDAGNDRYGDDGFIKHLSPEAIIEQINLANALEDFIIPQTARAPVSQTEPPAQVP